MNSPKITIRKISSEDTYPVRHPVLRRGRPLDSCQFEGDDLETTFHLGLFLDDGLVGVATYLKNTNPRFSEEFQYQLRGMAVLESEQGKHLGKALLNDGENQLKEMKIDRLWCNARIGASQFYMRNGYAIVGEAFDIPQVGIHYLMSKKL